jgi:hypothetical protein
MDGKLFFDRTKIKASSKEKIQLLHRLLPHGADSSHALLPAGLREFGPPRT